MTPRPDTPTTEALAQAFHEAYERLAPSFGYETRRESAVPWEQVPEQNRALMVAVVEEVFAARLTEAEAERDELRKLAAGYSSDADLYADELYKAGWFDPATGEIRDQGWKPRAEAAERRVAELETALDKGRRFERAYQESIGATPTAAQWDRLDSLQSAFLDAYLAALAAQTTEETG